ncbi:MAG: hypothetical protein PHY51_05725, partial [Candidatus Gracilibacteria bacterium]|nr:hypothetical protein [Candidatus Gracilibacteria bacterium]
GESLGISLLATTDNDLTLLEKSWELTKGLGTDALIVSPLFIGKAIKFVAPLWFAALSKIGIKRLVRVSKIAAKRSSVIKKVKRPKLDSSDFETIQKVEKQLVSNTSNLEKIIANRKLAGKNTSLQEEDLRIANNILREYRKKFAIGTNSEGFSFKNADLLKEWLLKNNGKILTGTGLALIGGSTYEVIKNKNGKIDIIKNTKSNFEDALFVPRVYPVETTSLLLDKKQKIHQDTKLETKKLDKKIKLETKKSESVNKSIISFDNSKDSFDKKLVNQVRIVNVRTRLNKRNALGNVIGSLENNEKVTLTGKIKEGIELTGKVKTTSSGMRFFEIKGGYFVAEKFLKLIKTPKKIKPKIDFDNSLLNNINTDLTIPDNSPKEDDSQIPTKFDLEKELFGNYSSSHKKK